MVSASTPRLLASPGPRWLLREYCPIGSHTPVLGRRGRGSVHIKTESANQHIETIPGVCGGKPRIAGHRITVANIVGLPAGRRPDQLGRHADRGRGDAPATRRRARQAGRHAPVRSGDQRRDLRHLQSGPGAEGWALPPTTSWAARARRAVPAMHSWCARSTSCGVAGSSLHSYTYSGKIMVRADRILAPFKAIGRATNSRRARPLKHLRPTSVRRLTPSRLIVYWHRFSPVTVGTPGGPRCWQLRERFMVIKYRFVRVDTS